jgi:hypothetical protein
MRLTRVNAAIAQELDELLAKLTPWALSSPELGNPTIHDFVKGLVLSTDIISVIDKRIPNGFKADWGQVIDEKDGNALSRECDIIIYRGQPFKEIRNKCIRFVFVDKNNVRAVIQVKSSIQSITKDIKDYCVALKKFAPEVWFIAECFLAKSISRAERIRRDLKNAGYDKIFYFYRMDYDSLQKTIDYEPFFKFIDAIRKMK